MRKESLFAGLLALLLVFALLGCEQVTSGTKPGSGPGTGASPNDKWTEVTSLDGLEGTWKSLIRETATVPASETGATDTISFTTSTETKVIVPSSGDISVTMIKDHTEYVRTFAKVSKREEQDVWKEFTGDAPEYIIFSEKAPYTATFTMDVLRGDFEKGLVAGGVTINQSKTRIKTEVAEPHPEISTDEEWKQYQKEYGPLPSGDMTVTFSAGAPYTMTTTQIFHKQ